MGRRSATSAGLSETSSKVFPGYEPPDPRRLDRKVHASPGIHRQEITAGAEGIILTLSACRVSTVIDAKDNDLR